MRGIAAERPSAQRGRSEARPEPAEAAARIEAVLHLVEPEPSALATFAAPVASAPPASPAATATARSAAALCAWRRPAHKEVGAERGALAGRRACRAAVLGELGDDISHRLDERAAVRVAVHHLQPDGGQRREGWRRQGGGRAARGGLIRGKWRAASADAPTACRAGAIRAGGGGGGARQGGEAGRRRSTREAACVSTASVLARRAASAATGKVRGLHSSSQLGSAKSGGATRGGWPGSNRMRSMTRQRPATTISRPPLTASTQSS